MTMNLNVRNKMKNEEEELLKEVMQKEQEVEN
jgi:hypothetical protein